MASTLGSVVIEMAVNLARFRSDMSASARIANTQLRQIRRETSTTVRQFERIGRSVQNAFRLVATGYIVRQIVQVNDAYTLLTGRLKLVTANSAELQRVQSELFRIAQRTRTEYEGTVDLYVKLAQSAKELGASQGQLLRFTEGVGNALILSGSSAQSASGALLQLSQLIAGTVVQAQEFNSLLDGAPEILRTVANNVDRFGGSIGKLREEVKSGKFSTREFFAAFLAGTADLERRAGSLPTTVGQAFIRLKNLINQAIGQADLSPLVKAINDLAVTVTRPDVQSGLIAFATGIGKIADAATKGAAAVGTFFKSLSENLRIASNTVPEVERLEILLGRLRKAYTQGAEGDVLYGFLPKNYLLDKIAETQTALDQLRGRGKGPQTRYTRGEREAPIAIPPIPEKETDTGKKTIPIADQIKRSLVELNFSTSNSLRETAIAVQNSYEQMSQSIFKEAQAQQEAIRNATAKMSTFAEQAARNMQDAFAEFLFDPFKDGLRGMLAGFIDTIRQMVAQMAASKIFDLLGGLSGSSNSVVSAIGGFFKGAKAMGGPVSSGGAYLVGERGPELFVPRTSGTIVPNNAMGGVSLTYNIDARGADAERIFAVLPGLLKQTEDRTIAAVRDLQKRGRMA